MNSNIKPIPSTLSTKQISDTFATVTHCNLPNVPSLLDSGKRISLYDGKGNKLAYSFEDLSKISDDNVIHNYFKNFTVDAIKITDNKTVCSNTSTVSTYNAQTTFNAISGIHQLSIPHDNNTINGASTLIDENPSDKYIANVEYLTSVYENTKTNIENMYNEYINSRDWSNFVVGSNFSSSLLVNTGAGCDSLLIFASFNILLGDSHSRTTARENITNELHINVNGNDKICASNQYNFKCIDYWTTGHLSPSSYANWLQGYNNVMLYGCCYVGEQTNATIYISAYDSGNKKPVTMYDPHIICIRCKSKEI